MKKALIVTLGIAAVVAQTASAVLVESWENTLDGWNVQNPNYTSAFDSSLGITDGSYSLALTGTVGPNYGQMLLSPSQLALTALLGNAASISLDVYTPPASFGYYLQFDMDVNNADTGYQSLVGYSYIATSIGNQTTLTFSMPAGIRNTLAASSNPTELIIQIGGGMSPGNETMYLDNLSVTTVPEPSTTALLGFGALAMLARRRRA